MYATYDEWAAARPDLAKKRDRALKQLGAEPALITLEARIAHQERWSRGQSFFGPAPVIIPTDVLTYDPVRPDVEVAKWEGDYYREMSLRCQPFLRSEGRTEDQERSLHPKNPQSWTAAEPIESGTLQALATKIASHYPHRFQEARSEAIIALMVAQRKHRPDLGAKVTTHAYRVAERRVAGFIQKEVEWSTSQERLPSEV